MRAWVQYHFKLDTRTMTADEVIAYWVEVEYIMNEVNKKGK
jgi:hypothetical protein